VCRRSRFSRRVRTPILPAVPIGVVTDRDPHGTKQTIEGVIETGRGIAVRYIDTQDIVGLVSVISIDRVSERGGRVEEGVHTGMDIGELAPVMIKLQRRLNVTEFVRLGA